MGSFTNPLKEVRTLKDTYFDQLNGTVLFAENHNSDMSNTEVVDNFLGKSGEESERAQHWTRRCTVGVCERIPRVQVTLFTVF